MRLERTRRHRMLSCEHLEGRRLLAANLPMSGAAVCADPTVDAAVVADIGDPLLAQERIRTSADSGAGAQKRPGRGWDASEEAPADPAVAAIAVDAAITAQDCDPLQTRDRIRTSEDSGVGQQKRPGRGWDAPADEPVELAATPTAVDAAITTGDCEPLHAQERIRIAADPGAGAHERLGHGWDTLADEPAELAIAPTAVGAAVAADDCDPLAAQDRIRTSGDSGVGAQKRPGRGWDPATDAAG